MTPLLLGHRGARAFRNIPENTLESFGLCLQHGCDGFEFDVRRSADGQAVICHDAIVNGFEIERTASKKLKLPTLEEVLRRFSDEAFLDIELKVPELETQTIAELRKHPPKKGYVISSFLPDVLMEICDHEASIPMGLLCETPEQLKGWKRTPAQWVIPQAKLVDRELVELIHGSKKKIMVWTANRAEQMRQFAAWNVDAIISDDTDLLVRSSDRIS